MLLDEGNEIVALVFMVLDDSLYCMMIYNLFGVRLGAWYLNSNIRVFFA